MAGATVHPIDDKIFVRRQEVKQGQVLTPDNAQPTCLRGVIVAVGPGMPTMDGKRMELTVLDSESRSKYLGVYPGDGIIYTPDVAMEISIESGKFDVLSFRDAICVLKQEQD
jgi:co-chaperonin GroES (HSP10)